MSSRWQQIRGLAAALRERYAVVLGSDAPFPLDVSDLAEQVCTLSAFPDPTLDPRINGELNPVTQSIRLRIGLDEARRRFIIAHELGHYIIEGTATLFQDDQTTVDERVGGDGDTEHGVLRVYNTRERQEQEANTFALELLIPADVLWQMIQQPGWTIDQLAATFGVSDDALRTQLVNVSCLLPVDAQAQQTRGVVSSLDPEQQTAVGAPLPVLVVAGPGTGKTRSIVVKYATLVAAGVDPASIVALTFSNKAAEEMRARIIEALSGTHPDVAGRVEVSTFHAWGLNFLKSYGAHVGLPLDLQLRANGDLFVLLKRRLDNLPLEQYKALHDPGQYLRPIMRAISRAKDELHTPATYHALVEAEAERLVVAAEVETAGKTTKKAEETRTKAARNAARLRELAHIYEQYEALLRAEGVVDYGDLIMQSVAALRIPEVARELHERYQYILVDEFQDINYASGMLVALLDGGRGRVWAVGDPWQSIFRFRGASTANLAEFSTVYPGATTVSLVRNYRSVQGVLDASHAVMAGDPLVGTRAAQQAQRQRRQKQVVHEWAATDQASEYAAIAHDLLRRVGGRLLGAAWCTRRRQHHPRRVQAPRRLLRTRTVWHRLRFADHAVLCRKHTQVAAIVAVLEAHGIPVAGGGELLQYPEVKDALAVCALTQSLNSVGMLRALTLPEYRLSADDLELLVCNADAERRSLQRAIRDETIVRDLSDEGQTTLQRLRDLHDDLSTEHDAWRVLTRYLFDLSTTMRQRLTRAARGDAVARRELHNLGQLVLLARNFVRQARQDERDAGAFITYLRLLIEADEAPKVAPLATSGDAVRVMTIHAAKGLEWGTVYVPGLQKDVFPPRNQGSVIPEIGGLVHGPLDDEQAEEHFLLYVAMTRAQHRLVLSRSEHQAGKVIPRSSLLPMDAPWPTYYVATERACRLAVEERRLRGVPGLPPTVAATSIVTYEKCPRRYMYQYGYQLYDDVAPYVRMHQTIHDAVDQLTEWVQADAPPPDDAAVEQLVRQLSRRHRLDGLVYQDAYVAEAIRYVQHVWHLFRTKQTGAQAMNQRFVVQRPAGSIVVRVDRVEQTADGTRYVQLKSGRPGKDDHLSTRIVLYALAAQAHHPNASLAIHYPALNETRLVEHRKGTLENHIAKIDAMLAGIGAQSWQPNYGDQCDTCPFNLICPV